MWLNLQLTNQKNTFQKNLNNTKDYIFRYFFVFRVYKYQFK